MPAHDCAHRDQTHLAPPRPEDRKCVVFAPEQPVSGGPHQEQVLGVGVQPAQDAQHALDEQRALHQPLVDKVLQVVQVPHVIAFKLEPRALRIAQAREDRFDVGEGVAEDLALGPSDVACLPGVFPVTDPAPGLVEGKVHRPHVQRTQLWPRLQRIGQPVVQRHRHASARGDVDDRVRRHGDAGDELVEHRRIGRRATVHRVAGVQMQDRRPCLCRPDRLIGDLVRRQCQMRRHRWGVHRSGDRTGDDDLAGRCHVTRIPYCRRR